MKGIKRESERERGSKMKERKERRRRKNSQTII